MIPGIQPKNSFTPPPERPRIIPESPALAPTAEIHPSLQVAERIVSVNPDTLGGGQSNYWDVLANPYRAMFSPENMEAMAEMERWSVFKEQDREVYGSDVEVFREFLDVMEDHFDESDIVKKFRQEDFAPEESDWKLLFNEFERARRYAFDKVHMSPEQRQRLLQAKSELNWTIRELALSGAVNAKDCLLMINPKARKVEYMDSKEAIATLKRSGSVADTEQFRKLVLLDQEALAEHAALPQIQEALADPDFPETHVVDDLTRKAA